VFAEHKVFWMSFRMALLQIVNAIEVELRTAGLYVGPTTSEMRAAWKEIQKKPIAIDIKDMQEKEIAV
jgi:hypothetical protein